MATETENRPLELWGGVECTIARVRNRWRDQTVATGHADRIKDLDEIAALGIKTLRYPVLWEKASPDHSDLADFSWHDARLSRLSELGVNPIAGLVHHGSGPKYTSLLDPAFGELLSKHAGRVAKRYPWIQDFTPVNEPLTTARFSALYGHWYPHRQNVRDFVRALINQCRATVLAMQEIRKVSPAARLIQTEDLGRTFSTPLLKYQADYENDRRWLTFDLLYGRVDRHHPWFDIFVRHGISQSELLAFVDAPCPPDIIGINHYLTSDRFLDHRRSGLPAGHQLSGNGRHRYADLEAVRVALPPGSTGPEARLREAWARYGRPIAVTEAHHGCSREEQVRWLVEVWDAARKLNGEGMDIRAVTVWAMFGLVDWNSLLVREDNFYEPGAFDVRDGKVRLTALGQAAKALSEQGRYDHPVLDTPGWWHRQERLYTPPVIRSVVTGSQRRTLLIASGSTPLGKACHRIGEHRGLECVSLEGDHDGAWIERAMRRYRPWAVVDALGSGKESNEPDGLVSACRAAELPLLTLSWPSTLGDDDKCHPRWLRVKRGLMFGPWDWQDYALGIVRRLGAGETLEMACHERVSPAYVPDLVHTSLDLLIDGEAGDWHLSHADDVSLYDFAMALAHAAGLDPDLIVPIDDHGARLPAVQSRGLGMLPPLDSAVGRFIRDCEIDWRPETREYADRKAR